MSCIPLFYLHLNQYVVNTSTLKDTHKDIMNNHDRVTYLHIPFTGKTVVLTFEAFSDIEKAKKGTKQSGISELEKKEDFLKLYHEVSKSNQDFKMFAQEHVEKEFHLLRDAILKSGPLNQELVAKVSLWW